MTTITLPAAEIKLNEGEHYAGIILGKDGASSYHLILLRDEAEEINWKDASDWAPTIGGELPNRCEQSLLYANLKEQFQGTWYWSSKVHASDSDYAWVQDFDDGDQFSSSVYSELRARAVRRIYL